MVRSVKDLEKIFSHFDKYPLITQKRADYLLLKQAYEKLKKRAFNSWRLKRLSRGGLKLSMNKGLSELLKESFPDVIPV